MSDCTPHSASWAAMPDQYTETSLDLLAATIDRALEHREFTVAYQPKVSLTSNRIIGFEAFPQWVTPHGQTFAHDALNAVVDASGCSARIVEWLIENSCRQLAEWQHAGPTERLAVAIDASPWHLEPNLVRALRASITASGVDASAIWLELTEPSLPNDNESAEQLVRELASLDVNISLAALGPGLPTLTCLPRLHPREVRIAATTIARLGHSPADTATVDNLIHIAHAMGCFATAGGVETAAQLDLLRTLHCDAVLGAGTSRPLAAGEITESLASDIAARWWPHRSCTGRGLAAGVDERTRLRGSLSSDRGFSERQLEIVDRLLRGERVPTIARKLFLSQSTVRNHLSAIFRTLGVHSQEELLTALYSAA